MQRARSHRRAGSGMIRAFSRYQSTNHGYTSEGHGTWSVGQQRRRADTGQQTKVENRKCVDEVAILHLHLNCDRS